jgi:hypothetical protein
MNRIIALRSFSGLAESKAGAYQKDERPFADPTRRLQLFPR